MAKLMQSARLTQIARMETIIVYTQPLDTAALRVAAAKRWSLLTLADRGWPYNHYHGRRVDFCEGGEELVCVWFVWEDCKGECFTFIGKASTIATREELNPSLTVSLA